MKKLILILSVFITLLFCSWKVATLRPVEKPVSKSINLSIYRENNYSAAAYDNTIASVHITVCKVIGKAYTPVCDRTFSSMQLQQFPDIQNALNSSITIPNLLNSKEKLLINYSVTYNTQGSKLTLNNYMVTNAAKQDNLKINI